MNKQMLIVAAVIVAAIVGGGAYLMIASDETGTTATTQSVTNTNSQTATSGSQSSEPSETGTYQDYSAETLATTSGTKILFFHAPWCPQCRALEADINNNDIPNGVTIFKVDYDSNQTLKQKYGVTLQTTLVSVDDSGNLIKKFVAYSEPTFDSLKSNLL